METLPTKQWSCDCGFYGAKLYKTPTEIDYKFFLNHVNHVIGYAISQGHNFNNCDKAGA